MSDFFGKNLEWKIFSLVLAIGLWLVVINIKNPEETMSFTLPVTIENMETVTSRYDLIVSNLEDIQNKTVKINLRGNRLTLESLKNNKKYLNEIKAVADLELFRYAKADEINKIPIVISFSDEYRGLVFEERNQIRYLEVILEKKKSITKAIQVDTVGQTEDGYVILEPKATPGEIVLTGAESLIDQVNSVRVSINVEDIVKNKKISNLEPKVYDDQGKEILGLEKSIDSVSVNLSVGKKKKVVLQHDIQGTYAPGHITTGIKIEPEEVVIVGAEDVVNKLNQLRLSTIIFDNLDATTTFNPEIILPPGVSLWNGEDTKVAVTIEVKNQIVKEFKIPTSSLTVKTDLQFRYISREVTVYLQGIEEDINRITENMIAGTIDVSDYGVGKHTVTVDFNLPKNIKQVGETPRVEIELIAPEEQQDDLEDGSAGTE
ncbi:CdaR family protein [Defluviitalea saccharophila]|uniref:CdaR family protein n=1 Tax=Defluviitalea saccharophila TaxID=879970 RepID=A0ABZ2Y5J9_9FIRM